MSLYSCKYNPGGFCMRNVEKNGRKDVFFGIIDGENGKSFFCIIFQDKICVKIIPKLEKSTTQVRNMCYNIIGLK